MILAGKSYVPTLAIRASEMNGLEFLPAATKDRMTPCFLLAPWANSSTLGRAVERIERAFPGRDYFLDIDRDYQSTNSGSGPQQELARLKDPSGAFSNWVGFVEENNNIIPCIQYYNQSEKEIVRQIEAFQILGRPYCMRIVRDRFPENVAEVVSAFAAGGAADFAIIVEGGWARDPLNLAAWFSGILTETLQIIDARVPVVLSCTSIPKFFSEFEGINKIEFSNRGLIERISEKSNRKSIVYGDWGSTRPRENGGFANRPLDRIDYPTEGAWYIARSKDEGWDYREAAINMIKNSGVWGGDLSIWGEEMIRCTAIDEEIGINSPQKNVASRVNIHLHRQAFYGDPEFNSINFDEDWED